MHNYFYYIYNKLNTRSSHVKSKVKTKYFAEKGAKYIYSWVAQKNIPKYDDFCIYEVFANDVISLLALHITLLGPYHFRVPNTT